MNKKNAIALLKKHDKRVTTNRLAILELFMDSANPFSSAEVEKHFSNLMDRATMYRTLNTFVEMDLILKLFDDQGNCLYFFNHENHQQKRLHPHLHCSDCGKILCLPSLPESYLDKLQNFNIKEMKLLMQGKCIACSN